MKTKILGTISLIALIVPNLSQAQTIGDALKATKPIIELNTRYETVDQVGIANEAEALTSRLRFGVQTGKYKNWSFLAEMDAIAAFTDDYNSTINGKTSFPNVVDPDGAELNRLQLVYTPSKTTSITIGRQRIILDDARFVGNVGWRQDEQTFDALRFDTKIGKLSVTAAYLDKINRIVLDERDWKSDSYIVNASYAYSDAVKLTGFAYLLDFSDSKGVTAAAAKASSTNTYGARVSGSKKHGEYIFGYAAQYAKQTDTGLNPANFELGEYMLEGSVKYKKLTLKANYEVLEGNGVVGFVTPLGTNHAFQGFSDVFAGTGGNKTLANGIKDLAVSAIIALPAPKTAKYFKNPMLNITYHDFKTDHLGLDIGEELDAVFTFAITPKLSGMIKYADFDRALSTMPASRTKTWVQLAYKF